MALTVKIGTAGAEVDLTAYLVAESLRIEQRADAFVSTCSLQLVDKSANLGLSFFVKEKDSILVEDGATIYFAGTLANVDASNMAEGTEALLYDLECQDYNVMVEEVVINALEEYGGQQDCAIIDDLFDKYLPEINSHTPAGAPPGYVQCLHVFAEISFLNITLREALDRIATEVESTALEGYWYIDFNKCLHYFNVEDNTPAWHLSDTPDNVTSFPYFSAVKKSRQGANITNRIMVCGAEMALFVQDYDSHDYYNRWYEGVVRDNTLITVDEVMDHGYSLLAKWAYPDEYFDVTIRQTGLRAGMNVRFENSLFGLADRTNHIKNPSFEVNVTDAWTFWRPAGGGSAARDGARASIGNFSCKITASNAENAIQKSDNIALADGETITVQARLYRATAIASDIIIWDIVGGQRGSATPALTGSWEFLTVSWTNDTGGAVNVQLWLRNKALDGASEIWFDACFAEVDKGPYPVEYIDGTQPFCYWNGVAHNSTSGRRPVYTVTQLNLTWPQGTPTFQLTLGGRVSATALLKARLANDDVRRGLGPVVSGQLPLASKGWSHDIVFSATDNDTVAWAAGDILTAAGQTFSINPGNTGNMTPATVNYIYFDADVALNALQVTEAGPAVGGNIILICVAFPVADATKDAEFQVFGGEGVSVFIAADNIAANTITANEIAANTITAAEIAANTITAAQIAAATITATEIATDTILATNINMGIGDCIFSTADGQLLLGAFCDIGWDIVAGTGWWTSLRNLKGIIEGALHVEAGRWLSTRGLMLEEATTNIVGNPSAEVNVTNCIGTGGTSTQGWTRDTTRSTQGAASFRSAYTDDGNGKEKYFFRDAALNKHGAAPAQDWTLSIDYLVDSYAAGATFQLVLYCYDAGGGFLGPDSAFLSMTTRGWVRGEATLTTLALTAFVLPTLRWDGNDSIMYVDAFQCEQKSYSTSYCDGSLGAGYTWGGVPHSDISSRDAAWVNLDSYVRLVTGNDSMSFRVVAKAPHDSNSAWDVAAKYLFDFRGANDNNRVLLYQVGGALKVFINGADRLICAPAFSAGDWLDIMVVLDFAADSYALWLNGDQVDTDATALVAPAITDWVLGARYDGAANWGGFLFSEYAMFNRLLVSTETTGIYALQRPLIDMGAGRTPGIYILDGRFQIASSATGNRIEITADEIAGYSSAGVKQFYLRSSDGKAVFGGGGIWLDREGINFDASMVAAQIRLIDAGIIRGYIYSAKIGNIPTILIRSGPPAAPAHTSELEIGVMSHDLDETFIRMFKTNTLGAMEFIIDLVKEMAISKTDVRIAHGLYVGRTVVAPDNDDIWCDGEISTDGGATRWHLKGAGGVVVTNCSVEIEINGNTYSLLARTP